jgi:hypothetical protein
MQFCARGAWYSRVSRGPNRLSEIPQPSADFIIWCDIIAVLAFAGIVAVGNSHHGVPAHLAVKSNS